MERPAYDTKYGIEQYITSIQGLHELITARQQAVHEARLARYSACVGLQRWVLFGRQWLDERGNFGAYFEANNAPSYIPADEIEEGGDSVMLEREVRQLLAQKLEMKAEEVPLRRHPKWLLPRTHQVCANCHEGWNVRTIHDSEAVEIASMTHDDTSHSSETQMPSFVGRTVSDVVDCITQVQTHRSDEWRLSVRTRYTPSLSQSANPSTTKARKALWHEATGDHIINPGDAVTMNCMRFYHRECYRTKIDREDIENITQVFVGTEFEDATIEPWEDERYRPLEDKNYRGLRRKLFKVRQPSGKETIVAINRNGTKAVTIDKTTYDAYGKPSMLHTVDGHRAVVIINRKGTEVHTVHEIAPGIHNTQFID